MQNTFDTLVVITPADLKRIRSNFDRLIRWLPGGKVIFIGSGEVGRILDEWTGKNRSHTVSGTEKGINGEESSETEFPGDKRSDRISFINENDIIRFENVHEVIEKKMEPVLHGRDLPRGITGWYYQQFLKMEYSKHCDNTYYMSWDGDTVPCKKFNMFNEAGVPFLDLKHEYNELYFTTMGRLIPGLKKFIEASFISEHMLFNRDIMKRLISKIEANDRFEGSSFYEKIINCIPLEDIQKNSFSEFETYGSFVCMTNPGAYRLRDWHSFRLAGEFFDPDTITDEDYEWLSRDFDAVSFEKGMFVREDHKNLFDNREYQKKLTARQMLKIAQEEFTDGYIEQL